MFRRNEKQSFIEARAKSLKEAQQTAQTLKQLLDNEKIKVAERDKMINKYDEQAEVLAKNLKELNNKTDLLDRITALVEANQYNNEKTTIRKIRELVRDYQSQN